MKIDFDGGRTCSKKMIYEGISDSGRVFTINAAWEEHSGWRVERIMFRDGNEMTDDEKIKITEAFISHAG